VYAFPEGAIAALSAAVRYGVWRSSPVGNRLPLAVDRDSIQEVVERNPKGGWLSQGDVSKLLSAVGISSLGTSIVRSAEEAARVAKAFNSAIAMKVFEPAVLHKADVGGVLVNVEPENAAKAFDELRTRLASHGIDLEAASLTPMAKPGVEVLAGVTLDQVFGPLVAFGTGGYLVEFVDDVAFRIVPLTDRDAREMIQSSKAERLLRGYRGSGPADTEAVEVLLLQLAALAEATSQIHEIDLNPVIVHAKGEGLSIVDARIRLGPI
jgi:acyl-CoA synthetase (NDP forming)